MADFKVNGITPAVGNIKYNQSNVQEIYMGSVKVWPFSSVPNCVDRIVVFQICNDNRIPDDNFKIYLNAFDWADRYSVTKSDLDDSKVIGDIDQNCNYNCATMFIGSTDTSVRVTDADFQCPLPATTQNHFDPALLRGGSNTLFFENTQINCAGNGFVVEVKNYSLDENGNLTKPVTIALLDMGNSNEFIRKPNGYPTGPAATNPSCTEFNADNLAFRFNFDSCGE